MIRKRNRARSRKYSEEKRLEIGRRIYIGELSTAMVVKENNINHYTAREYLRAYKADINVAVPKGQWPEGKKKEKAEGTLSKAAYVDMTKEELIDELIWTIVNKRDTFYEKIT